VVLGGLAATAAVAAVAVPGRNVSAASGSSSQSVSATVVAGTLTVTAPAALVTSLNPATANTGIPLGAVAYTNTLNDGSSWSVTMTSTDWVSSGNAIHFTDMSVNPGASLGAGVGSVGTPTAGSNNQTFSGSDATPGTTASSPITLATGTASVQGVFTQSGSTMSVTVPGGTPAGVYTGTITYTITG
jgi:hypothetical protein